MSGGWNSRLKKVKRSQSASSKATYRSPAIYKSPSNISKSAGNFTARMYAVLTYSEHGQTVSSAGGAAGVRVYSLNNLFDPDVTGVGHQPVGFDQIMALYENYLVMNCKYKVSCLNTSASEMIFGCSATDAVGTQTDCRVYLENGMTNWRIIPKNTNPNTAELAGYVNLPKLHGIPESSYKDDSDYIGSQTAGPIDQGYLHVWVVPADNSSSVSAIITVTLEYECQFKGGKLTALS